MALSSIYQGAMMAHTSNPSCKHDLEDATHSHEGVNSSCGDEVTLSLILGEGEVIEQAAFSGNGCAISQASADIMAELITGKTLGDALELAEDFLDMIGGAQLTDAQKEALGDAAELEAITSMPARAKCAQLAWRTLKEIADNPAAAAV